MFGGGGGGLNPSKMKQMMEQMGIDIVDVDADEVIIRTPDADLVFTDVDVQRMDAQGQQTYQVVGEPERRERGAGGEAPTDAGAAAGDDAADADEGDAGGDIPQADVEIVAQRTGASEADAREALESVDGDLAAAVAELE
jgi:nascent polypeptide-associated complex subunit alpha